MATLSGEVAGALLGEERRGREVFVFVFFKCLYWGCAIWLLEEGLVQLLFRKICCEYKSYVFLVVLKSYFGSLRVVTAIMYLTPVL